MLAAQGDPGVVAKRAHGVHVVSVDDIHRSEQHSIGKSHGLFVGKEPDLRRGSLQRIRFLVHAIEDF